LIIALESRADTLSWDFVTSRLLHEESKKKELNKNSGVQNATNGNAFYSKVKEVNVGKCRIVYVHVITVTRADIGSKNVRNGHGKDAKATKCIFLGYSKHEKAYRLLNISNSKIIISRDVKFNEQKYVRNMKSKITVTLCDKFRNFDVADIISNTHESIPNNTGQNCGDRENNFPVDAMPNAEHIPENDNPNFEDQENNFPSAAMPNAENIPENNFATQGNPENYFPHNADEVPYVCMFLIMKPRCHIRMQKIIFRACVQIIIIRLY